MMSKNSLKHQIMIKKKKKEKEHYLQNKTKNVVGLTEDERVDNSIFFNISVAQNN